MIPFQSKGIAEFLRFQAMILSANYRFSDQFVPKSNTLRIQLYLPGSEPRKFAGITNVKRPNVDQISLQNFLH